MRNNKKLHMQLHKFIVL